MSQWLLAWINSVAEGTLLSNKYLVSLAIVAVAALLGELVLFLFSKFLEQFASKTKNKIDDIVFNHTKRPLFFLLLGYGIKLGLLNIGINETASKLVDSGMAVIFLYAILQGTDIAVETWAVTFSKKTKTNVDDVLLPLLHKITKVLFVLIGFLWVLKIWGIDISPYLAGVGISGIVLGLALQDTLKNVLGGVSLLLDKTYVVGDKVQLESGEVGIIHDIGLRSTKIVNFDNEVVYVPNGYLANSRVLNYARPDSKVRTNVAFGVEYGNDVEKVRKIVLKIITDMDGVLSDPAPSVQFIQMGDFALQFKAYFWVEKWGEAYGKKLEATEKIYNTLNKAKINFAYPTQNVYLKK